MEAYIVEWLSLLGRWLHMVVGVAWIGASLYFVWLDNHLRSPRDASDVKRGVGGELWAVHGGGFYHSQKYRVAPPDLPETLHWFKWEAYWTWISGVFLLGLIYWYGAEVYLVDPAVADLSKPVAVGIGIAVLLAGVAAALAPRPAATVIAGGTSVASFATVRTIVAARCASCHAAQPVQPGFAVAPKGLHLESDDQILTNAAAIYQQTVVSRVMPIGNLTGITDAERAAVGAWYQAGAERR